MSDLVEKEIYPKPGKVGGLLIRKVISFLRSQNVELPLTTHILIALSSGSDSVALALLMARYGRRIAPRSNLSFLHINHQWRGEASQEDENFARSLAQKLDVPFHAVRLDPPSVSIPEGSSWEEVARNQRKEIFHKYAAERDGVVFTAHHAHDLAETVLWRVLTGSTETHGGGICFRHESEMRPLLSIRKDLLREFLQEEGQMWKEDSTNHSGRFLRSRIRSELMPTIEALFPKAVENLTRLGLEAQKGASETSSVATGASGQELPLEAFFGMSGLRPRRAHWKQWQAARGKDGSDAMCLSSEIELPGGWRLLRPARVPYSKD